METKGFQFSTQAPTGLTEKTAAALNLLADGVQLTNCINAFLADYENNIDEEEKIALWRAFCRCCARWCQKALKIRFLTLCRLQTGRG